MAQKLYIGDADDDSDRILAGAADRGTRLGIAAADVRAWDMAAERSARSASLLSPDRRQSIP